MTLWLRARRAPYLVATVAVVGVLQSLIDGKVVALPLLFGSVGSSTWSMFLPVAVGVAVADSMASKTQSVEDRVTARTVVLDMLLISVVTGMAAGLLCTLGGSHDSMSGTVGQVALAVGVSTVVTLRLGVGPGLLAPIAVVLVGLGYGVDAPAGRYLRLMAPDSDPVTLLTAGAASLLVALTLIATRSVNINYRLSERLVD